MRLFVALDIDDIVRSRIDQFITGARDLAPNVRWVRPESLHVTLKFIGEQSETQVEEIKRALHAIAGENFEISFRGYGFFPERRAAQVFWIGIEACPQLKSLAATVDARLAAINIPKEKHAFTPHLTLARCKGASGPRRKRIVDGSKGGFERLQKELASLPAPEFGTTVAREFFLYQSELSPGGSRYKKLAAFALSQ
jgi:RNA 2',3'-cyclic 3'-phosphodiesterase